MLLLCPSCGEEAYSDKYACCRRPSGKAIKKCTHADIMVVYFSPIELIWTFFSVSIYEQACEFGLLWVIPITVLWKRTVNLPTCPSHASVNHRSRSRSSSRTGCRSSVLQLSVQLLLIIFIISLVLPCQQHEEKIILFTNFHSLAT